MAEVGYEGDTEAAEEAITNEVARHIADMDFGKAAELLRDRPDISGEAMRQAIELYIRPEHQKSYQSLDPTGMNKVGMFVRFLIEQHSGGNTQIQ